MDILRTGIIGLGIEGRLLLEQLSRNRNYSLVAVADQNKDLADDFGEKYRTASYDDYRTLIMQDKPDVLVLALPTHVCGECINLAAKVGAHVFKTSPLGRNLPEGVQWVKVMDKAGLQFHVGGVRRFAPGYLHAHQKLSGGKIGKVFLVRAEKFSRFHGEFGWRGDPVLGGGGVLIDMGYPLVDQITWNLGLPEQLYSLSSNDCSKHSLPPYRTEDTMTVTMNFADGAVGNLVCGWMTGPESEKVYFHGTEGTIEATQTTLKWWDMNGEVLVEESFDIALTWQYDQQLRHFAGCLGDPEIKPVSTAREHLANVAIIEAAYLSAKTNLPESVKVYGSGFDF